MTAIEAEKTNVLRPILDQVIIELLAEPKQIGSIIIPEAADRYVLGQTERGIVQSCGPGRANKKGVLIAPEVQAGEEVLIRKSAGTQFSTNGKHYVICEPADILAVEA